jgi:MoaA/NifB/PqqE/SkfB family radical SAM enzyme
MADAERTLAAIRQAGGAEELALAGGEPALHPRYWDFLAAARAAGVARLAVYTSGLLPVYREFAARLRESGVAAATLPLHSPSAAVHDALVGRPGAQRLALRALDNLKQAGLAVEIRALVVPATAPDLGGLVRLAAERGAARLAFGLPDRRAPEHPPGLGLPDFADLRPALAGALEAAREAGLEAHLPERAGFPLCLLAERPDLLAHCDYRPARRGGAGEEFVHPPACGPCAYRGPCLGLRRGALAAWGPDGVRPYLRRIAALPLAANPGRADAWSDDRRRHAARIRYRILRPTLECNQRCPFCSGSDTSSNVFPDVERAIRVLARWARIGVDYVSLSGGEPTLSPDLPRTIRAARQAGIPDVELITNGVRAADPAYAGALAAAGLTRAFVSLHTHREETSRRMTGRPGDLALTLQSIENFLERGILTAINCVITTLNYRELPEFAADFTARFGCVPAVAFAFCSPIHRADVNRRFIPRYTDVLPFLRPAMELFVARRQPFTVLSRPGTPPCFLREYEGFSDLARRRHETAAIDAPMKVKPPQCAGCKWGRVCAGVWKGYAEVHGTDEIVPTPPGAYEGPDSVRPAIDLRAMGTVLGPDGIRVAADE